MGLAIHSALLSLMKFYKKFKPDKVIACFDRSSWRKKYTKSEKCISKKPYKGQRRQNMTPKEKERYIDFLDHINELENLLREHTAVVTLMVEGLEADDLISGFVQAQSIGNNELVIVSSDKDLLQLMKYEGVSVFDPVFGKERTLSDWGNDPEYFLFEKCIRGDTSDNVQNAYPGVRKTRIVKCFNDDFERENLMRETWVMPSGREVQVGELFKENQKLMDLTRQPGKLKKEMFEAIEDGLDNPGKYSHFHFLKFCGKHELKKVAEQAEVFTRMLSR